LKLRKTKLRMMFGGNNKQMDCGSGEPETIKIYISETYDGYVS